MTEWDATYCETAGTDLVMMMVVMMMRVMVMMMVMMIMMVLELV